MKKIKLYFRCCLKLCFIVLNLASCSPAVSTTEQIKRPSNPSSQKIEIAFNSMITVIFEDTQDRLWVGSHCDGLLMYDPKQKSSKTKGYTYFTIADGLPSKNTNELYNRTVYAGNSIREIQEDKQGAIMVNTGDGLVRYDEVTSRFKKRQSIDGEDYLLDYLSGVSENNLQHNSAFADRLWFRESIVGGVSILDNKLMIHFNLPKNDADLIAEDEGPYHFKNSVYSLTKDSKGNIWLGTSGIGIIRITPEGDYKCINAKLKKGIVRCIFEDSRGRIWFSNVTQGLSYLDDPKSNELVNFTKEKGYHNLDESRAAISKKGINVLDGIQSISEDANGTLWFGTYADGVWRYDDEGLTHFTKKDGLTSMCVKTVYKNKKGNQLFGIGEMAAGLFQFDGNKFIPYNPHEG